MLTGLNHLTIAVSDLDRSLYFYVHLLGMKPHIRWNKGAYLSLGNIWFCLSLDEPKPSEDYCHIAFDVANEGFDRVSANLRSAQITECKSNSSEGSSLYLLDPDGPKLEIHSGNLESRLEFLKLNPYQGLIWL
jgi:catechol 2,3-dioxygenase-like lactoylglutathione lyase family enzyme